MKDLTDLVDIGDALDRRIETYSGGMRRRLTLAAALVHKPDVLGQCPREAALVPAIDGPNCTSDQTPDHG
ncbi:MAG: ATP-binding cassette domain-containing protein [Aquihabitans sp.]